MSSTLTIQQRDEVRAIATEVLKSGEVVLDVEIDEKQVEAIATKVYERLFKPLHERIASLEGNRAAPSRIDAIAAAAQAQKPKLKAHLGKKTTKEA